MVVALVLSIAAALVVPSFGQGATARLREAGPLVAADLAYARSAAIAHGTNPRLLVVEPADDTYYIAKRSDTDKAITAPHDAAPYRVRFGEGRARALEGVTIASTNLQNNRLRFDLYGGTRRTADQGDGTITLQCDDRQITVRIDRVTGEATVGEMR
jgi:Tfp pilus assembly protein FimT